MNLSPKWVEIFQLNDIESIHWSNIGKADAEDEEILSMLEIIKT